jgi:DNA-binding transcriptional regulator YiaG
LQSIAILFVLLKYKWLGFIPQRNHKYGDFTMDTITLKQALKALGITQKDFAQHIGYSENAVSQWCRSDTEPRVVSLYVGLLLQIRNLSCI